MIEIKRTYDPEQGLIREDILDGYVFSPEAFAHQFLIERVDGYGFEGEISARFLRADNVAVVISGGTNTGVDPSGRAYVILTPECYAVPGEFRLTIYHTTDSSAECIYYGKSSVLQAESPNTIVAEKSASALEDQLRKIMVSANNVALFARNVGEIEGQLEAVQTTYNGIDEALANAGVWAMRENLLDKDAWWLNNGSTNIVCGSAARWSKSGGAYMKSIKVYDYYTTEPTAEQTAGATYVYHREAYTDATTGTSYPEAWYVYRDADDGITTSCVSLTGDAVITEQDGEVYDKAIQYNINANTAWGNMETLYYPSGASKLTYRQGETFKSHGYIVDKMEVGEVYTVSCWARLISGDEAWLRFGWGGLYYNGMNNPVGTAAGSEIYKVSGTAWQRIAWTFTFAPTGAEYTETTETATDTSGTEYTRVIRNYNWNKRVMIGVHRKNTAVLQLCGFRLSKGGLYGSDTVDTLKEELKALTARVAALEAMSLENSGS